MIKWQVKLSSEKYEPITYYQSGRRFHEGTKEMANFLQQSWWGNGEERGKAKPSEIHNRQLILKTKNPNKYGTHWQSK